MGCFSVCHRTWRPTSFCPLKRLAQAPQDSWGQAFPALMHLTPDGVINLPSLETAGSQLSRVAGVSASPDVCDSRVGDRRCARSSFALWEDLCEAMCIGGGQGVQEGGQGLSLPPTISQTWA